MLSRDLVDPRPAADEPVCMQKQISIKMEIILGRHSLHAVLSCIHLCNATVLLEQDLNCHAVLHGGGLLVTCFGR